ncbi:hypothetical protein DFH09DRAFT_1408313 [Mycena vulgaris]|nr:hypothetical protein DFH09DRAFT_1408313 [Mycena vulgaris]
MQSSSSAISTRKNDASQILQYAAVAAATARDLGQASRIPFLQTAAGASLLVLDEIKICLAEESVLSVKILGHIGQFAETLRNIQTSLQFQQELGKIKRFIRQHEISGQLRDYEAELQTTLEDFNMRNVNMATELVEFELDARQRHQELMTLLEAQNDSESSASASELAVRKAHCLMSNSSGVLSVLPPSPKFFHGRDSELAQIVTTLRVQPAHIIILGPGGMGKTTLAIAVLHHPEIIANYDQHHFISCESAFEQGHFTNAIGAHLGLEPSRQLSNAIVRYFAECGRVLLVLDNLETPWEQAECRGEVEDLLSALSGLPQLALLITMRGAERPPKITWTRPFLPPLEPLPPSASRQTFIEIADDPRSHDEESDLTELLDLSGHLPLAVNLLATVASYEGYPKTLLRWKTEKTALLSDGHDKRSNLETSITISLSSPRMLSSPAAKELLSLLSLLPDGLADVDLLSREAVDMQNIMQCRAVLLRISLGYMEHGRLKALSPIREYVRRIHPPSHENVERLRRHWDSLLVLWKAHKEVPSGELIARLRSNLANIDSVTEAALTRELSGVERQRLMHSILNLDLFSQNILRGESPLARHVVEHIEASGDQRLNWERICSSLDLANYYSFPPAQADILIQEGIRYFEQDPSGKGADKFLHFFRLNKTSSTVDFYKVAARYYYLTGNLPKALQFNQLGMTATEAQNIQEQLGAVNLKADLREGEVGYSVAGKRMSDEQAAAYWSLTKLRSTSDLCKLGRDILVTYGHQGSAREVNMLDIEAGIKFEKSEYADARAVYEAVVRMTALDRHPYFHANALFNLVKIDLTVGREEAHILAGLARAKEAAAHLGWTQGLLFDARLMAGMDLTRGDTAAARAGYARCFVAYRRTHMLPGATQCLAMLADPAHGMCSPADAFRWAGTYLALVRVWRDVVPTYQALRCLGDVFLAQGDTDTALNIFRAVALKAICHAQGEWTTAPPLFVPDIGFKSQMKDVA